MAGHNIIPAYDGGSALRIFDTNPIDLVVLDIMLPKISELSVLHEIWRKSSVPVLMLAAIEDEYTQVTSFDEQADDYMTKPFSKNIMPNIMTIGDVTVDFSGYTARSSNGKIAVIWLQINWQRERARQMMIANNKENLLELCMRIA